MVFVRFIDFVLDGVAYVLYLQNGFLFYEKTFMYLMIFLGYFIFIPGIS
jgi:hypothetical protein